MIHALCAPNKAPFSLVSPPLVQMCIWSRGEHLSQFSENAALEHFNPEWEALHPCPHQWVVVVMTRKTRSISSISHTGCLKYVIHMNTAAHTASCLPDQTMGGHHLTFIPTAAATADNAVYKIPPEYLL